MGRSGWPRKRTLQHVSMHASACADWADSFEARKRRERLARGLGRDQVLAAADTARRLGDHTLAVGLVRDLLVADLKPYRRDAYAPGDVLRRVLAPLGVDVDARSNEYRGYLAELLPDATDSLDGDLPATALVRRDLRPVELDCAATSAAEAVLAGIDYEEALASCLAELRKRAASARERELEWLLERIELRYRPDLAGLGRIWRAAAAAAGDAPAPDARLADRTVEALLPRLAASRDETEVVAALADALRTTAAHEG